MASSSNDPHPAEKFLDAIEKGNYAELLNVYAPTAVVWHNFDDREVSAQQNVADIQAIGEILTSWRYSKKKRLDVPGGFVQQHVATLELIGGETVVVPACIICKTENGRITRLEEYFDTGPLKIVFDRVAAKASG